MNINKIALDYLDDDSDSDDTPQQKKKKSRKTLITKYEKMREKYLEMKGLVEVVKNEGLALQKKYETNKEKMDQFRNEMKSLRKELDEMDDL
ncbi:MAG: hypothetical protein ACOYO1_05170 [Bacteroidales bacterium]